MSDGILERCEALLERIAAAVEGADNASAGGGAAAGKPATTGKPAKVTHDALTALVQPLVQNDAQKVKVKEVLTKFGLKRLGDAKAEQYEALYEAFDAIANAEDGGDDDLIG